MQSRKMLIAISILGSSLAQAASPSDVSVGLSGMKAQIDNGLVSVAIGSDGSIGTLSNGSQNLIDKANSQVNALGKSSTGYLDYYSGAFLKFKPQQISVIENTKDIVHIAYIDNETSALSLEYHFIVRRGVSGIYSYAVARNDTSSNLTVSELRGVYRFNPFLLDHISNGIHTTKPYLYSQLNNFEKIQDETWKLPDGSYYSKYDFAGYMRKTPVWGVYGNNIGAWIVPGSTEYMSGDDTKQDLMVHQDGLAIMYMTGSHFGTPDLIAPPGWQKLYGPWLLYVNAGTDEQMYSDALARSRQEIASWPYNWVNDSRFPVDRASVAGSVNTTIPLNVTLSSSLNEASDVQTLGYAFTTNTDSQGNFRFDKVRKGKYTLTIYANGGSRPGVLYSDVVNVTGNTPIPAIQLAQAAPVVWAIGQSDRLASEFRFGDQLRNYHWQNDVPANLTYTIGESSPAQDWYYAQTNPGSWNVNYIDRADGSGRVLNVAFAAASNRGMTNPTTPSLSVLVNGTKVKDIQYDNDKSVYRGALNSGKYHYERIPIDSGLLRDGTNTITFTLNGGTFMYDAVTLTK
ncbi:polysaccharide lyase family protein [Dickeya zeae]|uniref:rhamnogalacturonan endolyase n=1 Tax=Dickeya zeae TaxID=204042 RepID=A0AAE6YZ82_9GAMM|nr:polysaccharide lyase family protein [Dickeya zeae]QIZ51211.1 rhamnogalacturonate lyase [Dickeya zeae]QYM91028.1 rhamnogalacturonate lyase [Dickeya zeae]